MLGVSQAAASRMLGGFGVGGMFSADQGGQTYTQIAGAGGSDEQARQAANKVAGINLLPNSLFGFTDLVPALRDNPFLTTLLLGGVTGASGQVAQNSVTGRPLTENVLASALQGAGMMGAMHLGTSAFFGSLSQAMDAARESELRLRAPEVFADGTQAVMRGDLRFPAQEFNDYFAGKSLDPAAVAAELGAENYGQAMRKPDGEVVVPAASFFGRLDPEHQAGLMPSVIDPNSGRTFGQYEAGGPQRWLDGLSQTDPEMASSPEWQAVKEDLRQQYVDRGLSPENAEASATTAANIVSNLGRRVGMAPGEALNARAEFLGRPPIENLQPGASGDESSGSSIEQTGAESSNKSFRRWGDPESFTSKDFREATKATEKRNAANLSWRVIPGNRNDAPAVVLSPHAYAFLRKKVRDFQGDH